jgi:hypothetical protein
MNLISYLSAGMGSVVIGNLDAENEGATEDAISPFEKIETTSSGPSVCSSRVGITPSSTSSVVASLLRSDTNSGKIVLKSLLFSVA